MSSISIFTNLLLCMKFNICTCKPIPIPYQLNINVWIVMLNNEIKKFDLFLKLTCSIYFISILVSNTKVNSDSKQTYM